MDDWPRAREWFEKSLAVHPNCLAYSNLGVIDLYEDKPEAAARMIESALAIDARDYRVWVNLASARERVPELANAA
jgi:Flp pilus assembly protein TadD